MNKKIKQAFADDPETLRLLESQEQTELLKLLVKDKAVSDSKVKMVKIEYLKGDPGDTPVKGEDYFTTEEIEEFKQEVTPIRGEDYFTPTEIEEFKQEITPIKGVDYFDGKDADEEAIFRKVKKEVIGAFPTKEEILSEIVIPEPKEIDKKEIVKEIIKELPKAEILKAEDVIKELKKKQYLEPKDIKGLPINMNDMRWHGSGLSKVSHDSTLSGSGTASDPLSVIGGGGITNLDGGFADSVYLAPQSVDGGGA